MKAYRKQLSNPKCYIPDDTLMAYMEERLQHEGRKDTQIEKKSAAGDDADSRGKNYVMNAIVFPSMANIVYFLEMIAKHPELRPIFEAELKDLFGVRRPQKDKDGKSLKHKSYSPVFRRFVEAALSWDKKEDRDNFRLELLHILQQQIFWTMGSVVLADLGPKVANEIVLDDLKRAWTWTEIYAGKVERDVMEPVRPTNF